MAGNTPRRLILWGIALVLLFAGVVWQWQSRPVTTPLDQPNWSALTAEQKSILAPLRSEWNAMEPFRRMKWLGLAERYPDMSTNEQASVQRNMKEWAKLAPNERKTARDKFKNLQKFAAEDRQAVKQKWEEYNSLPKEMRDRLKKEAAQRPPPKTPSKPPVAANLPTPTKSSVPVLAPGVLAKAPAVSSGLLAMAESGTDTNPLPRSRLSPIKPPQSPLVVPQKPTPKTQTPPVPEAVMPCAEE